MPRSSDIGTWSAVPLPFVGGPGSTPRSRKRPHPLRGTRRLLRLLVPPPRQTRWGGGKIGAAQPRGDRRRAGPVSWPMTVRLVRGWLTPWHLLGRCWRAWSSRPPPAELQALLDAVGAGRPLYLFLREYFSF